MIGDLLDTHWRVLVEAGYRGTAARPGPTEDSIRQTLRSAGYADRDDLVDFFRWAQSGPEPWLFEYHPTLYSPATAVSQGQWHRKFWSDIDPAGMLGMLDESQADSFAPPNDPDWASWLPIAMGVDSGDEIMMDTSGDPDHAGSIWCREKHGVFRAFDSLGDAIQAATFCVVAGIWKISENGLALSCPRKGAPSTHDLDTPPYHDYVADG